MFDKDKKKSYMDRVQVEVQETGTGPDGEKMSLHQEMPQEEEHMEKKNMEKNHDDHVEVDPEAMELDDPEEFSREPKEVKEELVIFVPHKDFEARINQTTFPFREGVPTRITRDVANMLLEDKSRGYVK